MGRPPGFDRQQVLSAVERQFRLTGYAGTSLDDIAAAAALGRGSLYAAFGDKHSLFLEVLAGYCTRYAGSVGESLTGPDETALERLRAFMISAARFAIDNPDRVGCMAGKFAIEVSAADPQAAALINACFADQQRSLAGCAEAAQRHGDLDPDADPAQLACLLLAVARGMDVMAATGGTLPTMEAAALSAYSGLPLTRKGRRAATRQAVSR